MLCLWSKSRHTSPSTHGLQGLCSVFGGSIGFQPRKSIVSREGLFIQNPIPCFPLDFVLPQPVSRPFLLTLPGPLCTCIPLSTIRTQTSLFLQGYISQESSLAFSNKPKTRSTNKLLPPFLGLNFSLSPSVGLPGVIAAVLGLNNGAKFPTVGFPSSPLS